MGNLKERFENYSKEPDARVWEKIEDAMVQKAAARRRRTAATTVGLAAVALAIVGIVVVAANQETTTAEPLTARTETTPALATPTHQDITEGGIATASIVEMPLTATATTGIKSDETVTAEATTTVGESPLSPTPDETVPGVPALRQANTLQTAGTPSVGTQIPMPTPSTISTINSWPQPTTKPQPAAVAATPSAENAMDEEDAPTYDMKSPSDTMLVTIPNAFSPDDMGADNADVRIFKVYASSTANLRSFEMFIYSRRGGLVYHSRDINQGWDGTSKGHALPMGTYVYVIEINDALAGLKHYTGTVTLLR